MPVSVAFTYNGSNTVVATLTGTTNGVQYSLEVEDGDTYPHDTQTASGASLTLTVATANPSAGYRFDVWVKVGTAFGTVGDYLAATVFQQGSTAEYSFPAAWTFDGTDTITVTGTFPNGLGMLVQMADSVNGGWSTSFTGTGASQLVSLTAPAAPGGTYFYGAVYDSGANNFEAYTNRMFAAGVADAGVAGNPGGDAPPPPDIVAVLRYGDPPLWRLIVTNRDGDVLTTLDKRATERGFVFGLNQPATATGLVPSDDPEINIPAPDPTSPAFLSHNTRFIYGLRREHRETPGDDPWVCRYAGIVLQLDDVGADAPTSRYTAFDPWAYLMSRPIRQNDGTFAPEGGILYEDARASDMALDLLANTIAVDGTVYIDASDTGLLEDTDVIPGTTVFDRGISVGEAWNQLCETGTIDIYLRPVYDPIGRPGVLCELVIAKQLGEVQYDAVMGWDRASRSLTDLSRLIDGTRLADRVQFYAGQGGSPVTLQSDGTAIAAYGEWWAQQFMVGKQTQAALVELLALAQLQIRKNGAKSIAFSPAPERAYLALRDYGLGDYVPVWASRNFREPLGIDYDSLGPLSVSISGPPAEGETLTAEITEGTATPGGVGYLRLYAIPIELDDNGVERPRDLLTASESANSF